jgi:hypothetical protein
MIPFKLLKQFLTEQLTLERAVLVSTSYYTEMLSAIFHNLLKVVFISFIAQEFLPSSMLISVVAVKENPTDAGKKSTSSIPGKSG